MKAWQIAPFYAGGSAVFVAAVVVSLFADDPAVVLVALAAASAAFVSVLVLVPRNRDADLGRRGLVIAALIGLAARLALIASPPVLEDDVYRYLWDGAVLESGHSPYAYSPQQVYDARLDRDLSGMTETERAELASLAELSRSPDLEDSFLRINYPSVPTIYPPLAEALFGGLSVVAPGELVAMKIAIVVLDAITAFAILVILARRKRPRVWFVLYWWNPLIVLVFAGSAHMDALPMSLLTAAIAVGLGGRRLAAGLLFGLACAAKLFPVVTWPALRKHLGVGGTLIALVVFAALYAIFFHPRMFEGLVTFATIWQINGAIHAAAAAFFGSGAARVIGGLLVIAAAIGFAKFDPLDAAAFTLATLVLASPAVNPWYVAWLVPLAAARRSIPLTLLSLTVMASYVRFLTGELPNWLPWLEFGIPLLAALTLRFGQRGSSQPTENAEAAKSV